MLINSWRHSAYFNSSRDHNFRFYKIVKRQTYSLRGLMIDYIVLKKKGNFFEKNLN